MRLRIITRLTIKGKEDSRVFTQFWRLKFLLTDNPFTTLSHVRDNQPRRLRLSNVCVTVQIQLRGEKYNQRREER